MYDPSLPKGGIVFGRGGGAAAEGGEGGTEWGGGGVRGEGRGGGTQNVLKIVVTRSDKRGVKSPGAHIRAAGKEAKDMQSLL